MRRMVVWLQNFQGGQSSSKYPTYIVQFMISPQMRFSWPKKWEKQSFSNEKMVVWLHNFWGGLSSSKYTILNHFWLGQLKPPRLTQCKVLSFCIDWSAVDQELDNICRFTPTAAHPPWSGILQAISYGPACPQQFPAHLDNMTMSLERMTRQYWQYLTRLRDSVTHQAEDCLYLNIFRFISEHGLTTDVINVSNTIHLIRGLQKIQSSLD